MQASFALKSFGTLIPSLETKHLPTLTLLTNTSSTVSDTNGPFDWVKLRQQSSSPGESQRSATILLIAQPLKRPLFSLRPLAANNNSVRDIVAICDNIVI